MSSFLIKINALDVRNQPDEVSPAEAITANPVSSGVYVSTGGSDDDEGAASEKVEDA